MRDLIISQVEEGPSGYAVRFHGCTVTFGVPYAFLAERKIPWLQPGQRVILEGNNPHGDSDVCLAMPNAIKDLIVIGDTHPMIRADVSFYEKSRGDGVRLTLLLPGVPNEGTTILLQDSFQNDLTKAGRERLGRVGVVEEVVMTEDSHIIDIFVKKRG